MDDTVGLGSFLALEMINSWIFRVYTVYTILRLMFKSSCPKSASHTSWICFFGVQIVMNTFLAALVAMTLLPGHPFLFSSKECLPQWILILIGPVATIAIVEGSLEVKLPTIWIDEKQSREEAERRERLEERRVEEKE